MYGDDNKHFNILRIINYVQKLVNVFLALKLFLKNRKNKK
ncbi:MAG: hypothetical protein PWP46_464 [Fusobacteriaceae bacterium]|jgi:hypothetical protein|nr:hypothetical protein [Fusobacteriaceae bacterium]